MAKKVNNKSAKATSVQNRIAALKAAGINTEGMLSVADANGDGFVMRLVNGKLTMVDATTGKPVGKSKAKAQKQKVKAAVVESVTQSDVNDDEFMNQLTSEIIENGYVRNTKLFRRWVMAQVFRMLRYQSNSRRGNGFNAALRVRGYKYQWDMVLEELRVCAKLEEADRECYAERSRFFTKEVIIGMFHDYLHKMTNKIDNLNVRHCRGREYKRISRYDDIFCDEIDNKVYKPIRIAIRKVGEAQTGRELYDVVVKYVAKFHKLNNWDTPMAAEFVDAFKGAGAFYTMKNMILFHDCKVHTEDGQVLGKYASMDYVNSKADEFQNGYGWKLFAVMKKLIKDNRETLGSWAEGLDV